MQLAVLQQQAAQRSVEFYFVAAAAGERISACAKDPGCPEKIATHLQEQSIALPIELLRTLVVPLGIRQSILKKTRVAKQPTPADSTGTGGNEPPRFGGTFRIAAAATLGWVVADQISLPIRLYAEFNKHRSDQITRQPNHAVNILPKPTLNPRQIADLHFPLKQISRPTIVSRSPVTAALDSPAPGDGSNFPFSATLSNDGDSCVKLVRSNAGNHPIGPSFVDYQQILSLIESSNYRAATKMRFGEDYSLGSRSGHRLEYLSCTSDGIMVNGVRPSGPIIRPELVSFLSTRGVHMRGRNNEQVGVLDEFWFNNNLKNIIVNEPEFAPVWRTQAVKAEGNFTEAALAAAFSKNNLLVSGFSSEAADDVIGRLWVYFLLPPAIQAQVGLIAKQRPNGVGLGPYFQQLFESSVLAAENLNSLVAKLADLANTPKQEINTFNDDWHKAKGDVDNWLKHLHTIAGHGDQPIARQFDHLKSKEEISRSAVAFLSVILFRYLRDDDARSKRKILTTLKSEWNIDRSFN